MEICHHGREQFWPLVLVAPHLVSLCVWSGDGLAPNIRHHECCSRWLNISLQNASTPGTADPNASVASFVRGPRGVSAPHLVKAAH